MAGASVTMDMRGLLSALDEGLRHMGGTDELTAAIGEQLVSSTIERFEDGKGPEGEAWKPSQRAEGRGGRTLLDKGRLRSSIVYEATPQRVVVGTNVVYAAIHQFGGQAGRGRKVCIPARAYLGINEEDIAEIRATMADFVAAGFKI